MQLPTELQKFLFQAAQFDPKLARHFEKREIVDGSGQMQELAAARAEVRAKRALVAAPANEGRIRGCRGGTHKLFFKKSPEGTKKVAGGVGFQTPLRDAPAVFPLGTKTERRKQDATLADKTLKKSPDASVLAAFRV